MKDWIPLLQTLVWPVLVVFAVVWLRRPLAGIAAAVEERVKGGASLEAGPVKLGGFPPRSLDSDRVFEDAILPSLRAVVQEVLSVSKAEGSDKNALNQALTTATREAAERIRQTAFLKIDSRPLFREDGREWLVQYAQYRTVSALLDDIWYTVGTLPNQSYGSHWVLKDKVSGRVFTGIGRSWALTQGWFFDKRSLEDIGIRPGMTLLIVDARREVVAAPNQPAAADG